MTETNNKSFIEVVCSEFNEFKMQEKGLEKSPELKVQIFLNKNPANHYIEGYVVEPNSTSIACGLRSRDDGRCSYSKKSCKYNHRSLKE